jgi:hypothetical protein
MSCPIYNSASKQLDTIYCALHFLKTMEFGVKKQIGCKEFSAG